MRLPDKQTHLRFAEFGIAITNAPQDFVAHNYVYLGVMHDHRSHHPIMVATTLLNAEAWQQLAYQQANNLIKEPVDPFLGLHTFQARNLASGVNLDYEQWDHFNRMAVNLAKCYLASDATLAELCLAIRAGDREMNAVQGTLLIDDYGVARQKRLLEGVSANEIPQLEGINYVKLDGPIGCLANGAGLAMATMDMLALYGETPYLTGSMVDLSNEFNESELRDGIQFTLSNNSILCLIFNLFIAAPHRGKIASQLLNALESTQIPTIIRLGGFGMEADLSTIQVASSPHIMGTKDLTDATRRAILAAQGISSWRF